MTGDAHNAGSGGRSSSFFAFFEGVGFFCALRFGAIGRTASPPVIPRARDLRRTKWTVCQGSGGQQIDSRQMGAYAGRHLPSASRLPTGLGRRQTASILHMPSAAWTSRRQTVIILHLPPAAWPSRRQMAITTCHRRPVCLAPPNIMLAKLNQLEFWLGGAEGSWQAHHQGG